MRQKEFAAGMLRDTMLLNPKISRLAAGLMESCVMPQVQLLELGHKLGNIILSCGEKVREIPVISQTLV